MTKPWGYQQQHGNGQGVVEQGCQQTRQRDMVEEELDLNPQIKQRQHHQQHWHSQAAFVPVAGQPGQGSAARAREHRQQGGSDANARPTAHRNANGQGHGEPKQAGPAKEDQAHQR